LPGTKGLNVGGYAELDSLSCASAGNCLAGGYYSPSPGYPHAFVASEGNGFWYTAVEMRGSWFWSDTGSIAAKTSVSCAPAGNCSGVGYYYDSSGHRRAFVVDEP
jgi:hypothetical protein